MKKIIVILLLMAQVGFAQREWTVNSVPNTRLQSNFIHISDPDDWITDDVEANINTTLDSIRSEADVFVVVLSSIGDQVIEVFANNLFNTWGIGDAETDNGVLMLMVEDQHKLRFEVGYGLENVLTDALCQTIFTQVIMPYFIEGDYNGGLYAGVCAVVDVLEGRSEDISQLTSSKTTRLGKYLKDYGLYGWLLIAMIIFMNIFTCYVMIKEMTEIKKEGDFTHSDMEKVTEIFNKSRQEYWIYPFMAIVCISPPALLICPFYITYMKKKEKIFRDTPRNCEYCGNTMHRLSEEEENAFMTDNQIFEEENVKVADYDIWVCGACGNKIAVQFLTRSAQNYATCPSCQCLAGKKERDEVLVPATHSSTGKGFHHYTCLKCGNKFTVEYVIPMLSDSSSGGGGGGSFGGGSSGGGGSTGSW